MKNTDFIKHQIKEAEIEHQAKKEVFKSIRKELQDIANKITGLQIELRGAEDLQLEKSKPKFERKVKNYDFRVWESNDGKRLICMNVTQQNPKEIKDFRLRCILLNTSREVFRIIDISISKNRFYFRGRGKSVKLRKSLRRDLELMKKIPLDTARIIIPLIVNRHYKAYKSAKNLGII